MKSILATLVFFMLGVTGFVSKAQEGVITYEVKLNIHRTLPKEREALKSMIPEFNISKQALYFNADASHYKRVVDEEEEALATSSGNSFRFKTASAELYVQPSASRRIAVRELNGKKYLVQDSTAVLPWKFGNETKHILGHTCKQAIYVDEKRNQTIVAWYTEKLRPFLGPDSYYSLPGAVLEIDINNGERVTRALQIDLRPLKKGELIEPTKGEKITEKQFQAMMSEQMERMRQNGGTMIIRN